MGDVYVNDPECRAEDMVNHPPHYTQGKVECIEALEASMDPVEFAGLLKGQVIKYVWRFEKKWDPCEDLEKAQFYLDRLVKHMKAHPDIFRPDHKAHWRVLGYTPEDMALSTQELQVSIANTIDEVVKGVNAMDVMS